MILFIRPLLLNNSFHHFTIIKILTFLHVKIMHKQLIIVFKVMKLLFLCFTELQEHILQLIKLNSKQF